MVPKLEVAIAMLRQNDTYLLQRRTMSQRSLGGAVLIGCFGGKRNPQETYLQAIVREIGEETNLSLEPGQYTCIDHVDVPADATTGSQAVHGEVYAADVPAAFQVVAYDGELVRMGLQEMYENRDQLAPVTRAYVLQTRSTTG